MPDTIAPENATEVQSLEGTGYRIDRENNVIRGVKLIGFESKNGRTYAPSVLKQAVHLYEGVKVNIDHPEGTNPRAPRSVAARLGVIRSARFVEGKGVFGDFHYNPKHSLTEQVLWDAENNPSAVGFSHNAILRLKRQRGGKDIVESIASVRSMDLVADPATTVSLFESDEFGAGVDLPEGVISDQMQTDAQLTAMRKIVNTAHSLMWRALGDGGTAASVRESLRKVAADLVSELASEAEGEDDVKVEQMTLADLRSARPDLIQALEAEGSQPTVEGLQQELESLRADKARRELTDAIESELRSAGLDPADEAQVSQPFRTSLEHVDTVEERRALIEDRANLLKASLKRAAGKPITVTESAAGGRLTASEFLSRVRR